MTIRILDYKVDYQWDMAWTQGSYNKLWVPFGFETKVCVEGVNKEFLDALKDAPCFSLLQETERKEYQREIKRLKEQYKEVCKDVDRLSEILDKVIEVVRDEIDE